VTAKGAQPAVAEPLALILTQAIADLSPGPIAIAVSGGGDSMALLDLAHSLLPALGFSVHAATVDHGLRRESAAEAAAVATYCESRGIPHSILSWTDGPSAASGTGNLMDMARQARAQLLADWARGQGIQAILLGHTSDDQAEGFVMNLSRAAGIDGLAGMRAGFLAQGLGWRRPLLAASRAQLRAYLTARGIGWADDPTNEDDLYTRARARKAMAHLAGLGLTANKIAASVAHLQSARAALNSVTADAARSLTRVEAAALVMDPKVLVLAPEIRRRLFQTILKWMAGAEHPPRAPKLDRLVAALEAGRATALGGLRFVTRKDEIWVAPEIRALTANPSALALRWHLSPAPKGLIWRPIGPEGLLQRSLWRKSGLPRLALEPGPALWRGDQMVASPVLEPQENPEFRSEIAQSLADCISLH
jgi:tRNA(Ile)-lysidine synthase